jgi:iron complex transport system substrate-binding protein
MAPWRRALLAAAVAGLAASPARAQPPPRMVRDAAERSVAVPERVGRVVAAGPPAAVLLWSVAPDLLAGWVRAPRPAELDFMPEAAAALPVLGRLTERDPSAGLADVAARRPDLVLDYGSVGPRYVAVADRVQAQTGVPALLLDGALARIPETCRLVGEILDRREAAAGLAAAAERILADAAEASAALHARGRPSVYVGRGPHGLLPAPVGSAYAEVAELVGARIVTPAGWDESSEATAEQVAAWDPDWIIAADTAFAAAAARTDPAWRSARAVRQGRLVAAPGLPAGWLGSPPSVNRLLGLVWLPALFGAGPRDTLPARVAELYALLYRRRPDAAQVDTLLRGALPMAS